MVKQAATEGYTEPDPKIDLKGIDVARQSNSNLMTLWLGQDGFDYGFQADYKKLWQDEIDGIREVALHDKECQISIEYKPNEPRSYSLLSNLFSTLLAIKEVNLPNLGVTLDFAHSTYIVKSFQYAYLINQALCTKLTQVKPTGESANKSDLEHLLISQFL